jgi:hypothetical protein
MQRRISISPTHMCSVKTNRRTTAPIVIIVRLAQPIEIHHWVEQGTNLVLARLSTKQNFHSFQAGCWLRAGWCQSPEGRRQALLSILSCSPLFRAKQYTWTTLPVLVSGPDQDNREARRSPDAPAGYALLPSRLFPIDLKIRGGLMRHSMRGVVLGRRRSAVPL